VNSREFQDRLLRRARRAGVSVAPELGLKLETYYRLLAAWNEKINLSGLDLTELKPEAIDRLLIEPLVAARHALPEARRMLDIGSGGGSPAIPFALALPGTQLLMVEAKTRKSVFLREVVRKLELPSTEIINARYEELLSKPELHEAHDLLTIRAVRIEARVLTSLQAFVKSGGRLLLFRGTVAADPAETVTPPLSWCATYPLIESRRSRLVVLEKREPGPGRVPRETTAATK
jgi:16S rRNA (guanine527-N7)-methyltransferase